MGMSLSVGGSRREEETEEGQRSEHAAVCFSSSLRTSTLPRHKMRDVNCEKQLSLDFCFRKK